MRKGRNLVVGLAIGVVAALFFLLQLGLAESGQKALLPGYVRRAAAKYRYQQAHTYGQSLPSTYYLALAANLDPDDPQIWSELCGELAQYSLDPEFALGTAETCRRAVTLREDAANYQALGVAYQAVRAYPQAADAFSHAHQLDPANALTVSNLMTADLERQQYDEAVSVGEAFLASANASGHATHVSSMGDIYAELGFAYQQLGRTKEAEAAYAHTKFTGCTGLDGPLGKLDCKLRNFPPDLATSY